MGMVTERELDFFIENNLNVLFRGMHGVGKTAIIKQAFDKRGLDWRYFSASTMDPWVDFIGIPKEVYDDETCETFIRLIRPENFKSGKVEVIMMDELNRAKPKVRNAVMELIQFGTINGESFGNLRMVWAAINPEDSDDADLTYDVERLDPAQKDRFDCIVDIPFAPHKPYFEEKFGKAGIGAVEWWHTVDPKLIHNVSPRRLEMALNIFKLGGDIRFVIPEKEINITALLTRIDTGSISDKLVELMSADNVTIQQAFSQINFTNDAIKFIIDEPKYIEKFLGYIQKDVISAKLIEDDCRYLDDIVKHGPESVLVQVLGSLISADTTTRPLKAQIKDAAAERRLDLTSENSFRDAVNQAIQHLDGNQADKFAALHSTQQNFNGSAALDTYVSSMVFMCNLFSTTKDDALRNIRHPYYQVGIDILHRMDDALIAKYDTNVLALLDTILVNDSRLASINKERCKGIFELYMHDRPTKS